MQLPAIDKILFIDIETVPLYASFADMPEREKELWTKKARFLLRKPSDTPRKIYPRAGIYAEYGKIVCISLGFFKKEDEQYAFQIKSLANADELDILMQLQNMLTQLKGGWHLCAHNGKEFDFPYIGRRMLIHQLALPDVLDSRAKKPWETTYIDTMEMWKFGDYKHFTSLDALTHIFNLPSPKQDMSGNMVYKTWYIDKDIDKIVKYCEKDVVALAKVYLHLIGNKKLKERCQILTN